VNDIEKLSSGMKKALAVQAKKESAAKVRKIVNEHRALIQGVPVDQLLNATPLEPKNTLGDNGDGQNNLLPRDQFVEGLTFTVSPWANMDDPHGYYLYFAIDEEPDTEVDGIPVPVDFDPFDFSIDVSRIVVDHGPHELRWSIEGRYTGNFVPGPTLPFFIDIYPPNMLQEPDALLPPGDLPNGDITQDYLDQNGGVTFTIPPYANPLPGDKFTLFINGEPYLVDQDVPDPQDIVVDQTVFAGIGEGLLKLTYDLEDRAGNRNDRSLPLEVRLIKTPAPTDIRAPQVPEGATLITLADARDGVTVLHDYDTPIAGETITVLWQGKAQPAYAIPGVSVDVPFDDIKEPGDVYSATVQYIIDRNGTPYPSPSIQVNVDLSFIGPENPDEPDIVNPTLQPLTLTSSTGLVNQIAPADKDAAATITVPLYTPINVGEVVEVFYAHADQSLGATTLGQPDLDAGQIVVTVPWAIIDGQGNGTIPAFYRIYPQGKPENAQQSPSTDIVVTVHNLQDLPVVEFSNRQVSVNIINCNVKPWINGVDVKMVYPVEADDLITVHWVLDTTTVPPDHTVVPTNPHEPSRMDFAHQVTPTEATRGEVTFNVWWGEHLSALTEGCIVASWSLKRGEVTGSSGDWFVRYSRIRPSGGLICPDDDDPEED